MNFKLQWKSLFLSGMLSTCMILLPASVFAARGIVVSKLSCEHLDEAVGLGTTVPRLTWILASEDTEQAQTAYQVLVASSPELLSDKKADRWNSEKVESDESVLVEYDGESLSSRDRSWWKVRVWDKNGKASAWSEPGYFEIGLISEKDWEAKWITIDHCFSAGQHPGLMFRKEFESEKQIESARLYISSLGVYEAEINGKKVGDQVLTPGWTSFTNRVQYQTYDVTSLVREGSNAIGVMLADGWYRDFRQRWARRNDDVGPQPLSLIANLEIMFTDGTVRILGSDESWKSSSEGPILYATIYNGETYDARLEKLGWSEAGYDDGDWGESLPIDHEDISIVAPASPAMRTLDILHPVDIFTTPEGDIVADMGQNMVGWIRLQVSAPAGTEVTLRHAEVLDKEGNFYTENLRDAKQSNTYICKGEDVETWEPRFTFQGFRYVAVEGLPGEVTADMLTGVVVHSDLARTGTFSCNDDLINQLQHNIIWGQKGNFVDVPTDCPQRDERLGWTGDTQVFGPTACFNMNCAGFYTKWLADLALDQHEDGAVPKVIPNVLGRGGETGWQDAGTIVPWTVYRYYGDERILEEQYQSMKALVDYMRGRAGDAYIWGTREHHYGDWLAFATTRSDYPGATTDKDLLASAYFYHSANLLQQTADILGHESDAHLYRAVMEKIKVAFAKEYLTPNGRLSSNTQTAYVVALSFGVIPEELEEIAALRLAEDVRKFGHLTTGFLGTPDLCHVLTKYGYLDEAYMLLYRKKYPSWLYPVTQGATTIWERWDGQKPDGSFQDKGMNSFNHYAYGAVGDWLYRKVAGIDLDPVEPGFKSMVIKPYPGHTMNNVKASHESSYGTISSEWQIVDGKFQLTVSVPVNTEAEIYVPATGAKLVSGGEPVSEIEMVEGPGYNYLKLKRGSGTWSFESDFVKETGN